MRTAVEDVISLAWPGEVDDDDDSQFAAVGTTGSTASTADTNKLHHRSGNWRFQPVGGATESPSNSFGSVPDADQHTLRVKPFTMECWLNLDAIDLVTALNGGVIASKYTATGNQRSWLWVFIDEAGVSPGLGFYAYDGTSLLGKLVIPLVEFTPVINTFYHLVAERDEKNKLRLFVDGKVLAIADFPHDIFDGSAPVRLGMFDSSAGNNRHIQGSVEDFRIAVDDYVYRDEFTPPVSDLAATLNDSRDITEDYNDTNYRVTVAGTTNATLPFIFHSSVGPDADTGVTTLSVTAPSTFTRPAGDFLADGFLPDMAIITTGFTDSANNGTHRIVSVLAGSLVVVGTGLVTETGGGDEQMVQTNESGGVDFAADTALRVAGEVLFANNRSSFVLGPPGGVAGGGLIKLAAGLVNGDAEFGDLTAWTVNLGLVVMETTNPDTGSFAFHMSSDSADSRMNQTINVTDFASDIDATGETISVSWRHGIANAVDQIRLEVDFLDSSDISISTFIGAFDTVIAGEYESRSEGPIAIPALTRKIVVEFFCDRRAGGSHPRVDNIVDTITLTDTLFPDDEFNYGVATGDVGLNAGISKEIKDYDADTKTFTLYESFPFPVTVGDKIGIHIGCSREASRCKALDNIINHRGFRFIPGDNKINRAPSLA